MNNPYRDVATYVEAALAGEAPSMEHVPYWSLLAVVMDRRVADVGEERPDETIDTVEVADSKTVSGAVLVRLRASTFVGRWYPVKLELRPSGECRMWFGAPDLAVDRGRLGKLMWPEDDRGWPVIYRFELAPLAAEADS